MSCYDPDENSKYRIRPYKPGGFRYRGLGQYPGLLRESLETYPNDDTLLEIKELRKKRFTVSFS